MIKITLASALLLIVAATIGASPGFCATYYVATTGGDSNPGTSASPWRTLQKAADTVVAGDTVIVAPGDYAGFMIQNSGTASAPILFQASGAANITSRNARTADGINIESWGASPADHIIIDGFTINNTSGTITRAGIRSVANTGVIIKNNKIGQTRGMGTWGIFTGFSENILIENNICANSVAQHGIYHSNSADNPVIRGNTCYTNYAAGIQLNADASMGGDGIISRALLENNILYDNGRAGGSAFNLDGVQDSIIRNNLLYNNHAGGLVLYQGDGAGGSMNNVVANNTIIQASDGRWAINISTYSTGNVLLNNIVLQNHTYRGVITIDDTSLPGFYSNNNLYSGNIYFSPDAEATRLTMGEWQALTGQDTRSITALPGQLFVNLSANDYHLATASPAIDRGIAMLNNRQAPTVDIEGNIRPQGQGYDIGTYERLSQASTYTIIASAGANGSISPTGSVTVNSGTSQTFAITANSGYHIADVLADGASVGAVTSYTFNTVTANHTIAAGFAPDDPSAPDLGINTSLHGKRIFPANNPWNQRIDTAPVDSNSSSVIARFASAAVHPDFGADYDGGPFGIPYVVVSGSQPKVNIGPILYEDESDPGPYPVPPNAPIEGGAASDGDRHVLVLDRDNWLLYELYRAFPNGDGSWQADGAAKFDLNSNALRPEGWTSCDAAGLPILPGLVRYDEVYEQGAINHAIRFTVQNTRRAYVHPATHYASSLTGTSYPPMGARFRLKASVDISSYPAPMQVILRAMKEYGLILADNGGNMFFTGAPDSRWNDEELNMLKNLHGSDFEMVQIGYASEPSAATPGDVNSDGSVNVKDLILVAKDFGKTSGFNPACDINGDGTVNVIDLILVARNYGK